jgi:hypothetical protein
MQPIPWPSPQGPTTGTSGNGPKMGNSNRKRNTLRNLASKRLPVTIPNLSPGSAIGYAGQVAGLEQSLYARLAAIRAQAAAARGQFQADRSNIQAQAVDAMAGTVNAALDRGLIGSSIDLEGRAAVEAQRAAALVQARLQRSQALAGLRVEGIQATNDYYTGLLQVLAQKRAEQAQMAAQDFQQNVYDAMQQNYQQLYRQVLQRLSSRGRRAGIGAALAGEATGAGV